MSSETEDYMSDAFLTGLPDVGSSLIQDRIKKRQVYLEEKKNAFKKKQKKSTDAQIKERLKEGLQSPIESENKGFKMLAKMGYKAGDSLGKSSIGIIEPIPINVKFDRSGLGRVAALKEVEIKRKEIRGKYMRHRKNEPHITPEQYRRRMTAKAEERSIETALRECQKSCEALDQKVNVEQPHLKWFWPDRTPPAKLDDDDDDDDAEKSEEEEEEIDEFEYSSAEKLEMLTNYMRTSYNYCHWCGVHYKDVEDLEDCCPGLNKDDH